MSTLRLEIADDEAGVRLDAVVARRAGISRAVAARWVEAGVVTVDGRPAPKSHRVAAGEVVEAAAPPEAEPQEPPPVTIVFEDDALLVVDKQPGLVVHRAPGVREPTLVDALLASGRSLADRGDPGRPGIVHRLDREVSGLLVVAKTVEAHEALSRALAAREMTREYVAAVAGVPQVDAGKIDAPVGRHPRHRTKMAVLRDGRDAVTHFRVRERFAHAALLDVRLETGRTHQIRTHLSSIGHPILGDHAYGHDAGAAKRLGVARPFLHAVRLVFVHPVTGREVILDSALPDDLQQVLGRLAP